MSLPLSVGRQATTQVQRTPLFGITFKEDIARGFLSYRV
jgi:hypothetical protein